MDIERFRKICLSFPNAAEDLKWENDLAFCIGGKMFAIIAFEPLHGFVCSFKCAPEKFAELIEREGIDPAPYLGRYKWVGLDDFDRLSASELQQLLKTSYTLVFEKLPKSVQKNLS